MQRGQAFVLKNDTHPVETASRVQTSQDATAINPSMHTVKETPNERQTTFSQMCLSRPAQKQGQISNAPQLRPSL
jgi:hypothetical protein